MKEVFLGRGHVSLCVSQPVANSSGDKGVHRALADTLTVLGIRSHAVELLCTHDLS